MFSIESTISCVVGGVVGTEAGAAAAAAAAVDALKASAAATAAAGGRFFDLPLTPFTKSSAAFAIPPFSRGAMTLRSPSSVG
jgi:hypothetical protein